MAKKAEGLRMIVDACGGSQQAFQMLMLEHLDNLAEASSKAISNIKFDKIVVWENGNGGNGSTSGFLQSMARTMPPMMQVLKDIGGGDMPDTLARSGTEPPTPVPPASVATNGNGSPAGHKPIE